MAERHPGEPFTPGDLRLLAALAPQVADVVQALELTGSLEAERDRVLTATDAERDRIRRDLHDGLGPSLAGIGLGGQAVQAHVGEAVDPLTGSLLTWSRNEVDVAVREVRRILDGLRPVPLDDVGIVAAVRWHADTLAASMPVRVTAADLPLLPPEVETAAYRITPEALTNVARHSGARSAEVGLRARDGRRRSRSSTTGPASPGRRCRSAAARGGAGLDPHPGPGGGRRADRDQRPRWHAGRRRPAAGGAVVTVCVALADDHPMFHFGLRAVLETAPEVQGVGAAADGAELLTLLTRCTPDVVLTDLSMPNLSGAAAIDELTRRHPGVGILVLTMHETTPRCSARCGPGRAATCSRAPTATRSSARCSPSPAATPSTAGRSPGG